MEELALEEIKNIKNNKKLWTKDFTLITIGTINSMIGHCIASFCLGLIVFDETNSTLLYAIYTALNLLPYIVVSLFVGPINDRFSRKKIIVVLDYSTGIFYGLVGILSYLNFLHFYGVMLAVGVLIGSINAFYQIAYDSFYPTLITSGNYSKGYSISSMIYPIASTLTLPLSALLYDLIGVSWLFIGSGFFFLFTATFELWITTDKPAFVDENSKKYTLRVFFQDIKEGDKYLKQEKGLKYITEYFVVTTAVGAVGATLLLPFFQSNTDYMIAGIQLTQKQYYSFLAASGALGRVIGAVIHYFFTFKKENNYNVVLFVYLTSSLLSGVMLLLNFPLMCLLDFINGLICVTSFTIRTSSTQSYVPNEKRGRFNSLFYMLTNGFGNVTGQIIAGIMGDYLYIPYIILGANVINIFAIFFIVILHKKDISKVYNNDV